jgi:hypothetical protein
METLQHLIQLLQTAALIAVFAAVLLVCLFHDFNQMFAITPAAPRKKRSKPSPAEVHAARKRLGR